MFTTTHKHLINSTSGEIADVQKQLKEAHQFIVEHCKVPAPDPQSKKWGIEMKRTRVLLPEQNRPILIGKRQEQFFEVVNVLATVERLMDALDWFGTHQEFQNFKVEVCNPSTSSAPGDNDLVLVDSDGQIRVRCEVCDVASSKAGQNGKEKSELKSLGCETSVPTDNIKRFICTSTQFANAIVNAKRKTTYYTYKERFEGASDDDTTILEVVSA